MTAAIRHYDNLTHSQRQQAREWFAQWARWLWRENRTGCGWYRAQAFAREMANVWVLAVEPSDLTVDDCEQVSVIVAGFLPELRKAVGVRYSIDPGAPRRGGQRAEAQYLGIARQTYADRLAIAEEELIMGLDALGQTR